MEIRRESVGSYDFIHIKGEIDITKDAENLVSYIDDLIDDGRINLVFDFSDISYVFSGVIRILVGCYKRIQQKEGVLALVETNKRAFEALDLVGINQLIKIYKKKEDFLRETGLG